MFVLLNGVYGTTFLLLTSAGGGAATSAALDPHVIGTNQLGAISLTIGVTLGSAGLALSILTATSLLTNVLTLLT